jgi:hypothetical protein
MTRWHTIEYYISHIVRRDCMFLQQNLLYNQTIKLIYFGKYLFTSQVE